MKLIYVCNNDVSVYESQVLSLLDYIIHYKKISATLVQGYKNKQERDSLQKKLAGFSKIDVRWVKIFPQYGLFEPLVLSHYKKEFASLDLNTYTVVHVRSEYLGYIFMRIKKEMGFSAPILVDVRGVMTEEWKYRLQRESGFRRLLSKIQSRYFTCFSNHLFGRLPQTAAITCVSDTICKFLKVKYNLPESQLYVNPNIAGTQFVFSEIKRKEIRKKYAIKDDELLAICSTGGGDIWQKDYQVIPLLIKKGIRVINLARKDPGIEGCLTTTVPFQEMPAMLSAADIAVLWREDTFMNNSASPSKFSEFAIMGLYVIHNGSVDIARNYIQATGAGVIINEIDEIKSLSLSFDCIKRSEWIDAGTKAFGMDSIGTNYTDIYNRLISL